MRSTARSKKSRSWRAKPTIGKAGRSSSGQVPLPSSAWPWSSSRMAKSCSAPEIRRIWFASSIGSATPARKSAKASEWTERTMGSSATKPKVANLSESSSRTRAPDSFEAVITTTPFGSAPAAMRAAAVSIRKLVTPEPASPVSFHTPDDGSSTGHERCATVRSRWTR